MPDPSHPTTDASAPRDWSDAFNAMPLEAPPGDPWSRLAPRLQAPRRPRHLPAWLGLAAAAMLVAVIAWPARQAPTLQDVVSTASTKPATDRLQDLQQESARLEALLAVARDDRVASASAMLLADALDTQVAGIDAALARPDLGAAERERLWQARVDALQQAAGFVTTQRLMASQGQADALLVSVD